MIVARAVMVVASMAVECAVIDGSVKDMCPIDTIYFKNIIRCIAISRFVNQNSSCLHKSKYAKVKVVFSKSLKFICTEGLVVVRILFYYLFN